MLSALPPNTGFGFIVLQHLDPDRRSLLREVLGRSTAMPVVDASQGLEVAPNCVYVLPPTADLSIVGGKLEVIPRRTDQLHLPINRFLSALAEDQRERAIAVILSGSGSDGAQGARAIKATGGILIVQEPSSAQFRGMPESALATGSVDYCLTPAAIAQELVRLGQHDYFQQQAVAETEPERPAAGEAELITLLALIGKHTGLDFSGYKRTTIRRRIARRMALARIDSLPEYTQLLRASVDEVRALAQDMLIHVTEFFRDPNAFAALQPVLAELIASKGPNGHVRVWVPGCSTGEEVYSLAIELLEQVDRLGADIGIKIFGTDLSAAAIATARTGIYEQASMREVSADRLKRYFDPVDERYRVSRRVREQCIFVKHDLTRDPPFAKLDLISCRNVLIYFATELQARIIPLLHHCLNPHGYLFLGRSESIGHFAELFATIDKQHRVFVKVGSSPRLEHTPSYRNDLEFNTPVMSSSILHVPARDAQRLADTFLLSRYCPPGVVVDAAFNVVQYRGHTGAYLRPRRVRRRTICCAWLLPTSLRRCTTRSSRPSASSPSSSGRAYVCARANHSSSTSRSCPSPPCRAHRSASSWSPSKAPDP
ncbi:MAG: hypothetical protein HC927_04855 [Deltaproteobacteria bacterium]|nr:hypothetical protein [Deltaproteobacteria bacterium]